MSTPDTVSSALTAEKPKSGGVSSAFVVLAIIILLDTFATSFVRLTLNAGMPPAAIAGIRLPIAFLVFTPIVLRGHRADLRAISRRDMLLMVLAGFAFSGQITLVFIAVENTAIMIVHVLFCTSLLWVATLEKVFLKADLPKMVLAGVILAFVGSLVIGLADNGEVDSDTAHNPTLGLVAGLIGSLGGAVYLVIGRKVRENVAAIPYIWGVFGGGMVLTTVILGLTRTPVTGYSSEAYFWLLVLLIVVQFGIHGGLNYIVGYLSATFVSISGQLATVTAAIAAFLLFGEVPAILEIAGSLVIMAGVIIAILGRQHNNQQSGSKEPDCTES